jgi:hypothetical protein
MSHSSTLTRYRPAIVALAVITAGFTVYYLHEHTQTPASSLHRSNAVHRRRRRHNSGDDRAGEDALSTASDLDLDHTNRPTVGPEIEARQSTMVIADAPRDGATTDGESEISWRDDQENEEGGKEGQNLLNMLYRIAEEQSRRDGYIHRGVACNSCGTSPIRGVRYRCSNCPDFDLCEQCESIQGHPKTHLFYKIRIPAPFFDGTRRPQSPRYPGKALHHSNQLPRETVKSLSRDSGRDVAEIEAFWDQFKCLAATSWPEDPLGFELAINRNVFDKCFLPSPLKHRRPPNMPIHDRMFAFFDTNGDGLIGFREFVLGIATIRTNDRDSKIRRTFDCYDMDGDGFVRRKDFLRLFWSYYTLTKEFTEDALFNMDEDILEGDNLRESLLGSQPISATFTGSVSLSQHRAGNDRKSLDRFGDLVINDGGDILQNNNESLGDGYEIIGDIAEHALYGSIHDIPTLPPVDMGREHEHPLATMPWPPPIVLREDVEVAVGPFLPLDDVKDVYNRLSVLQAAYKRREKVRAEAVRSRKERKQFYEHESNSSGVADVYGTAHEMSSPGNPDVTPVADNGGRIPPALEADAGQEYLYQILEESMNEMLDPLFRFREDLYVEAQLQSAQRAKITGPAFSAYNTVAFRKLCACELRKFIEGSYKAMPSKWTATTLSMPDDLLAWLKRQQEEQSDDHINAIHHLCKHGIIGEDEETERLGYARAQQEYDSDSDSDQSSSSVDGYEEHFMDATAMPPLPSAPLAAAVAAQGVDPGSPSITQENDEECTPHISDTQLRDITRAVDERDAARAEIARGIENVLGQGLEMYHESSDALERDIAERPLEDLLAETGFGVIEEECSSSTPIVRQPQIPQRRDPTLPQHRMNSETPSFNTTLSNSFVNGEHTHPDPTNDHLFVSHDTPLLPDEHLFVPHVPPLDRAESALIREKRIHWKYLIMLDCLVEEEEKRGGPGSLSYEEFQAVMKGALGPQLHFLSMFYDMVLL